jgi:putative addiction module component (TIGR02574 family)
MSMTLEQLASEAMSLTSAERAQLVERLVESLDPGHAKQVQEMWIDESRKRRDDVRNGRVQTISGDEALATVRRAITP